MCSVRHVKCALEHQFPRAARAAPRHPSLQGGLTLWDKDTSACLGLAPQTGQASAGNTATDQPQPLPTNRVTAM